MAKRITRKAALAIVGATGVLALGVGIPAIALADPTPSPSSSTAPNAPADREQRHAERRAELAAALAKELGIDEAKVAAALEKVETQRQADAKAERLAALKARLDQAVKDGKLTQEQADAITKAAEAGVLPYGGPGWGHHGGPR
jgi:HD-GYP domain-containing protein (c-di-GMP phosphodiesterase class II)